MHAHEHRIREFAYQIWESEGKPIGQDARHWEMACKLASADTVAEVAPTKVAKPRKKAADKLTDVSAEAVQAKPKKVKSVKADSAESVKAEKAPKKAKAVKLDEAASEPKKASKPKKSKSSEEITSAPA